jgi:hypothetical protein
MLILDKNGDRTLATKRPRLPVRTPLGQKNTNATTIRENAGFSRAALREWNPAYGHWPTSVPPLLTQIGAALGIPRPCDSSPKSASSGNKGLVDSSSTLFPRLAGANVARYLAR